MFRFLAFVDLLGTTYSASTLATGYGAYIAQPILRNEVEGRENILTEKEALSILEKCMRVLFYRDARSLNKVCIFLMNLSRSLIYFIFKYQVAIVTEAGVKISEAKELSTSWAFAEGLRGYGSQTQ